MYFRGSRRSRLWVCLRGDFGGCEDDDVMMMIVMSGWKVAGATPCRKGRSKPLVLVNPCLDRATDDINACEKYYFKRPMIYLQLTSTWTAMSDWSIRSAIFETLAILSMYFMAVVTCSRDEKKARW
jgi:hypothetical protein